MIWLLPFTNNYVDPLLPPSAVSLMDIGLGRLMINWPMVVATNNCSISYKISASGCGICPSNTTLTSVECSDVQQENQQCTFSVLTSVCGVDGNYSEPLKVPLQGIIW